MTSMCVCKVTSVLSDRLPCPWDSPGKNTGVGCHFLLQGIFLTQGSNPGLLCLLQWQVGSLAPVAPGEPPQRQPDESKNYPHSLAPQNFPKVLTEERKKPTTYLIYRRRRWQPTPVSLPGEFRGPGARGYSPFQFSHWDVSESCVPMDCSTPGSLSISNSPSLLKLMYIESLMSSSHLIFCHPLLLLPTWCKEPTHWKRPWFWKDWGQKEHILLVVKNK